ncbi:MAG: serine--tRNA ligase [Ignavibacteria bacterium]|nr:serine--tRNA ligase [Ignavibacteria bacterium]
MLDIRFVREHPDVVRENCIKKNIDPAGIDQIVHLDARRRELIQKVEHLKAMRNSVSENIAQIKKGGGNADAKILEMRDVGESIKQFDDELRTVEENIHELMLWLPNLVHPSVPIGLLPEENVEIRRNGSCSEREYRVDHLEIGKRLGILDFERGAKVTGSGFGFYVGKGARFERALINFFLDTNTSQLGYTEIMPPFVANSASMLGTAQLPKSADDMYYVEKDNLYLIPTAEVPITNYYRDDIIPGSILPVRFAGYSACFRREAGSYGKDTRGFLRVHEFNKVELVKFVEPSTSYHELESLVNDVEYLLQLLGLTYRVILLCSGDMTFGGAKTYDLEVWAPWEQRWLEVSSCTNFESFQARRSNIRYRDVKTGKLEYLHTLNGSGLATSRIMVALLEQYQMPDGKVRVPPCLRPYCGFDEL